jgi:hypothetical protein
MTDPVRIEEIEDRVAELHIALATLPRGSRALLFMQRELEELMQECAERAERWGAVLQKGQKLAGAISEARNQSEGQEA